MYLLVRNAEAEQEKLLGERFAQLLVRLETAGSPIPEGRLDSLLADLKLSMQAEPNQAASIKMHWALSSAPTLASVLILIACIVLHTVTGIQAPGGGAGSGDRHLAFRTLCVCSLVLQAYTLFSLSRVVLRLGGVDALIQTLKAK